MFYFTFAAFEIGVIKNHFWLKLRIVTFQICKMMSLKSRIRVAESPGLIQQCLTPRWLLSPFWRLPHQSWPQTHGWTPPAQNFNIKADFTESGSRVDRIHWTIYYVMWDEWWLTVTRVVFVFVNVFQLTRNRGRPLVPLAKETASVVSDASGLWDQGTPCWKR